MPEQNNPFLGFKVGDNVYAFWLNTISNNSTCYGGKYTIKELTTNKYRTTAICDGGSSIDKPIDITHIAYNQHDAIFLMAQREVNRINQILKQFNIRHTVVGII